MSDLQNSHSEKKKAGPIGHSSETQVQKVASLYGYGRRESAQRDRVVGSTWRLRAPDRSYSRLK